MTCIVATDGGVCQLSLPLAINDPAGEWTVEADELLSNTHDRVSFTLPAVPTCNIVAGATRRAVHWADDRDRIFRFLPHPCTGHPRQGQWAITMRRPSASSKAWNRGTSSATYMTADEANKPRPITAEEAPTFIGLEFTGRGNIKPGDKNEPRLVGFGVRGPVILIGTPEDNPLIKYLLAAKFLPYTPNKADMPGPGRGLVAWQRDAIGNNQESIAPHRLRRGRHQRGRWQHVRDARRHGTVDALHHAQTRQYRRGQEDRGYPELAVAWSAVLPDRIDGLKAEGDKISVLTHARTLTEVEGAGGKLGSQRVLDETAYANAMKSLQRLPSPQQRESLQKKLGPQRLVKLISADGQRIAVAFWGGTRVNSRCGRTRPGDAPVAAGCHGVGVVRRPTPRR